MNILKRKKVTQDYWFCGIRNFHVFRTYLYSQHPLIRTYKGTKNLFELTNVRINERILQHSFLSKEIKIWFELAKVRITGVRITGY